MSNENDGRTTEEDQCKSNSAEQARFQLFEIMLMQYIIYDLLQTREG